MVGVEGGDVGGRRVGAVILAGGAGRRVGGQDKPMLAVGGVPMLTRVLAAVAGAGVREVVLVGPRREGVPDGVVQVREEPVGGGPVAAVGAGLGAVGAEYVALLAADLPYLTAGALRTLVDALRESAADGAVFVDEGGRRQLLCGVWRVGALRGALEVIGQAEGKAMRALVRGLVVLEVGWDGDPGRAPYFDCDTEEDLRRAEFQ